MHPQDTIDAPETCPEAEEWRPVVGYEGWYSVSSLGRVRRDRGGDGARAGHVLRPALDRLGYPHVVLSRAARTQNPTVHSLVAAAFIGPRPPRYEVNHKDGHKTNNQPRNLEYVTSSGNKQHARLTGLACIGEAHPRARLTEADVRAIRASSLSKSELAHFYGVGRSAISHIRKGRSWRHVT